MNTYIIIYRTRRNKDSETYETSITANSIVEARKMARQEFNADTDYVVVSVRKEY